MRERESKRKRKIQKRAYSKGVRKQERKEKQRTRGNQWTVKKRLRSGEEGYKNDRES